jgi:predicted dehydrogenase
MLKLGIIGCGKVTTMFHLKALREIDEIAVTAVSDLDTERMEEVRRLFNAERGYLNYLEMLDDPEIQAIAICTPPRLHGEIVLRAVEKRKHVLCEKPLAKTVGECLEIKHASEEEKVVVLPVHNYLFTPALSSAHALMEQGSIGQVSHLKMNFENSLVTYRPRTNFRLKEAAGIVEDLLPHVLSISTWLAGGVEGVEEQRVWRKKYDVPDNAYFRFALAKGVPLEATLSWTKLVPSFRLEVAGEGGKMELDLMRSPQSFKLLSGDMVTKINLEGSFRQYLKLLRLEHPAFRNQYLHFLHVIEGKETPLISLGDEVNIVKTMEEVSSQISFLQ